MIQKVDAVKAAKELRRRLFELEDLIGDWLRMMETHE